MIEMVGRGQLSISAAAGLSQSCLEDGLVHEAVAAFASLGHNGAFPSNYERDLHRWLRALFGFELTTYPVMMNLEVPFRNRFVVCSIAEIPSLDAFIRRSRHPSHVLGRWQRAAGGGAHAVTS